MANVIHGVCRTDAMHATNSSAGLVSLKYFVGTTATAIDNGAVVAIDSLVTGEREVFKAVAPAADTALSKIALVSTPEVMHDERLRNLTDFYNEAGVAARGYMLHTGDIFSVSEGMISGTAAVGSVIELQADIKLKAVASATSNSTVVGEVIALETVGTIDYVVIRVG